MANAWYKSEMLSMYVDAVDAEGTECYYRVLLNGTQVKYITVSPGTYDDETLSCDPSINFIYQVPTLPVGDWVRARIYRESPDSDVSFELSNTPLAGVRGVWHPNTVDLLSLDLYDRLTLSTCVATYDGSVDPVIVKFARFEFELPYIEKETAIYCAIEGRGIGPAFLGHLTEHGRTVGLVIEKIDGRRAAIGDLEVCQKAVKRLHALGIVHGDLNRHNFIVSLAGVTLIDFGNSTPNGSQDVMRLEYEQLADQLREDTGRGDGFVTLVEDASSE